VGDAAGTGGHKDAFARARAELEAGSGQPPPITTPRRCRTANSKCGHWPCVGPSSGDSCWRTSQLEIWMAPNGAAIIESDCSGLRRQKNTAPLCSVTHFDELAARCDPCDPPCGDGVIDADASDRKAEAAE